MTESVAVEEITNENFDKYFFDVRRHRPQAGQIMAKFTAAAVFGDGPEKWDIIRLLKIGKVQQAVMVMRKIHGAREPDCYRFCREICDDLLNGMTDQQVAEKEYEFVMELFFYTRREYVPDDPHWQTIDLIKQQPDGSYRIEIDC